MREPPPATEKHHRLATGFRFLSGRGLGHDGVKALGHDGVRRRCDVGMRTGPRLPATITFWLLAVVLCLFLFAASAPSPLYALYAKKWLFSSTTVTLIYAVYASGALSALLVMGRLSDHLGRRPIVMLALVIQAVGMVAFIRADGVGYLYLGRVLQGIATGIASGALSAWLVDVEPTDRPRLGSLISGIALLAGLGSGGFVAALLVQYGPDPLHLVFWVLDGVYAVAFVLILFAPDVAVRSPGALRSMIPQIRVPQPARVQFVASMPTSIAIWALAGLFLSLGPALAVALVGSTNRVVGGFVIFLLMGVGAVASAAVRRRDPQTLLIVGSVIVLVGVGVTLAAVAVSSGPMLYVGSAIAGIGFGPAFSGVVRGLGPLAPPEQRGALFAALYVVVYVAISVPTIAAGIATTRYGLSNTTYVYGGIVIALAAATATAVWRRRDAALSLAAR
jgi:MFS family permease